MIEHPQQRAALFLGAHGLKQLQIASGIEIQLEILSLIVHLQRVQIGQVRLLGVHQIAQQGADRTHNHRMIGKNRRLCAGGKLPAHQLFARRIVILLLRHALQAGIHVFMQKIDQCAVICRCRIEQHFFRRKPTDFVHCVNGHLFAGHIGCKYLAGCNIRKANTHAPDAEINRRNIIVAVLLQHGRLNDRARCNRADDFAPHKSLCLFGVLGLLTDKYLVTVFYQFGNVALAGMKRNAAHRRPFLLSAVFSGQNQVQLFGCNLGVIIEHFIEITEAIQ